MNKENKNKETKGRAITKGLQKEKKDKYLHIHIEGKKIQMLIKKKLQKLMLDLFLVQHQELMYE